MPDVDNRNRRSNDQFDKETPKPVGNSAFDSDMAKPKARGWWPRRGEKKEAANDSDTHTYSENISRTLHTRYRDGVLHCKDKPAFVWSIGEEKWYRDGVLHCDHRPALIEPDGTQKCYRNGVLHCDHGPAVIEACGTRKWYRDGVLHCDHGPAVIEACGTRKWYYLGKQYTKSGFEQLIKDKEMLQCMDDVNSATQPILRKGDE